MKHSAVLLQVRIDSSRLPGKALKNICGLTVIEHAMRALKKIPSDKHVLVTATGDESYFSDLAIKQGFELFSGSRGDVLDRFIQAGRQCKADVIIRATGDNPLVAYEPASFLLESIMGNPVWDYTAMRGLPLGCGVEVFRFSALERAAGKTDAPYDHEHVTPYIYNNPEQFRLEYFDAPADMASDARVTLDTLKDYQSITEVFHSLYTDKPVEIRELVRYLNSHEK